MFTYQRVNPSAVRKWGLLSISEGDAQGLGSGAEVDGRRATSTGNRECREWVWELKAVTSWDPALTDNNASKQIEIPKVYSGNDVQVGHKRKMRSAN